MKKFCLVSALAVSILLPTVACADEVTDAAAEALKLYEEGKLNEAAGQFDYASTLIRQQRAEAAKQYLPGALDGWEAGDIQSAAAPTGLMGGMLSATRQYTKESASVELAIAADSPMLQSVMMMFTNPAYATMGGGKMTKVKDQKAILNTTNGQMEMTIVLEGRMLITLKGSGGATEQDLRAYAEAVDFEKLAAF